MANLGPGSFFGELALLKDQKRNATVRASKESVVCRLNKEKFDEITAAFPSAREKMEAVAFGRDRAAEVVAKVPMFKDCDKSFIELIVRKLRQEEVPRGKGVVVEGEVGNEMYIVFRGTLEVVAGKEMKFLAKLGEGAFFGEIALLKNTKRNATIRALEPCELYKLTKEDFETVIENYPHYKDSMLEQVKEKNARREMSLLPLHLAARQGSLSAVNDILRKNKKVPVPHQINQADDVGWTPFMEACFSGALDVARPLRRAGPTSRP